MARTAPVPNFPAIPGMNPGLFVLGGGGDGGGSGAGGGKGKGQGQGANGKNGGKDANGGGKGAGSCGPGSGGGCMNPAHGSGAGTHAGDPVDVATGRVYTLPQTDLVLTGPLWLAVQRSYSSAAAEHDVGLGHGWSHTLAWSIEARRRSLVLHTPHGVPVTRALPRADGVVDVPGGGFLRREDDGFVMSLDARLYVFGAQAGDPSRLLLTSVQDRVGRVITLEYDEAGRLIRGRDSLGREIRFPRRPDGRIETMALVTSKGRVASYRRYEYDAAGDLIETADALGRRTLYSYDGDHRLVRQVLPSGAEAHYRYDEAGRCVETWCARPGDTSLAGDVAPVLADGSPAKGVLHCRFEREEGSVTVIDSRQTRRFDLAPDGGIAGAAGVWVEQVAVDAAGEVTRYSDPNGETTAFETDDLGRTTAIVEPTGARTQYAYTAEGNLKEELDALGAAASYEWDGRGLLLGVRDAVGALVQYAYDARGLRVSADMPNGGRTRFEHDDEGNLVRVSEPDGATRHIQYDDEGRAVLVRDAEGQVTRYSYDAMGAVRRVDLPSGSTASFDYDPDGRLARYVDPTGAAFSFVWGGTDVLTEVHKPTGERLALRYDREQNLIEVHNERGEVHRLERDAAGRVVGELGFDGRGRRYQLDAAGRMRRLVDGCGEATDFERDAVGRILRRAYSDGGFDAFDHDPMGRLTRAETEATLVTYGHDARGNVVREEQEVAGERIVVESSFDATGALVGRTWSAGPSVQIERDAARRPVRYVLGDGGVVARTFDGLGREVLRRLPEGGQVLSRWQGLAGLAERRVLAPGQGPRDQDQPAWTGALPPNTVYAEGFARNEMGALVEHVVAGGARTSTTVDPLGRVTERRAEDGRVERYSYHGGGRLHEAQSDAPAREYGQGGALLGWGDVSFSYDGEARRTEERDDRSGQVTRHHWDGRGLLVASDLPDGTRVEHVYDAHARRLLKRVIHPSGSRRVTRFAWSGEVLVHERTVETAADGARVVSERAYVHEEDDGPVLAHVDLCVNGARTQRWTHYVLGEGDLPALLLSASGQVLTRLETTVWGRVERGDRGATPLRFSGQYEDQETGLYYNRYRFYDPRVGLFASADPIGLGGGWNSFEYVQSTPGLVVDPEGLEGVACVVVGGGVKGEGKSKSIRTGQPDIHPIVQDALPQPTTHGDKKLWPKGPHNPTNCAEPQALSDYIRKWEEKHNGGKPLDPNNPNDHAKIQKCMQDVNLVTAKQESGKCRAPCPNCSQLLSNLKDKWGGPKTKAISPGATGPNATDRVRSTPPTDKRWKDAHAKGKVK